MSGFAHHALLAAAENRPAIRDLFAADPARFDRLSAAHQGLLLDISKTSITPPVLDALLALAQDRDVPARIADMFAGKHVNTTENRAVLHTACRAGDSAPPEVRDTLAAMRTLTRTIHDGTHRGHSGKPIRHVINIGIGGSHAGPQLVAQALAPFAVGGIDTHFVSNIEGSDLARALAAVDLEATLFVIASKSFATPETMLNARIARQHVIDHYHGDSACIAAHFVALSTQPDKVAAFGIDHANIFPFADWVGGRFSAWSAIGLSVMLTIGCTAFDAWLAGGHAMDTHFRTAPLRDNLPVLLALAGIWHRNYCGYPALAVIPYHSALARLPAWLQQLDMESNGKAVTQGGTPVTTATGPVVFGEPGTDSQHTFFQWLHQSPDVVPVEFIGCATASAGTDAQHRMLMANLLAQSESLMQGHANTSAPHKHFTGDRPSITLLLDALSPFQLGQLMALYEHKIFVQGVIWDINSFDQFGVELGKVMAAKIEAELASGDTGTHDSSTTGLMQHIRAAQSPRT